MVDQPEVRVSDTWLYPDGTPVPEEFKTAVRQELGDKITGIVMDGDFGRALFGIINGLWDGEGEAPEDVDQILQAGRQLGVRSRILGLDCSAELEELEKLVRAAMARRKE